MPQFQAGRGNGNGVGARPADPNPIAGRPAQGPVRERERSMAPGVVQPAAPPVNAVPFAPNTNVAQPRVWQDPNPIVNRQQVAPARPIDATQQRQRAPIVSENPGLRAPAIPMSKDLREQAVQRGEVPQTYVAPAPYAPSAPPRLVEQRSAPFAPPPQVVEPRPAPTQVTPPEMPAAPIVDRGREQPRAAPAAEAPRGAREKDRALPTPRVQP